MAVPEVGFRWLKRVRKTELLVIHERSNVGVIPDLFR